MTPDLALKLSQQMLWTAALVSGPVIGISMLVGLIVSIFQVVTQIQEMTLTFIPKMFAILFVLIALGPWMLATLVQFGTTLFTNIPVYTR